MDRRTFLFGTGTLALSQLLAGCNPQVSDTLQVQFLRGSIPPIIVDRFHQQIQQNPRARFTPVAQLQEIFNQLQAWHEQANRTPSRSLPFLTQQSQSPNPAALMSLGDYWLAAAIEQQLIQPLDITQLQTWNALPRRWQELVRRNQQGEPDAQGQIWAAPYRWGSTVILYNRDKINSLGWTPTDWSDLWRPELRSRISLIDQSREVIGLTLKRLGQSYNTQNLNEIPNLEQQLQALHQQVRLYSSNRYIEPLIIGDTWVAVGWSTDVLPVMQRYREIAVVVPQSGTALWADLWVNPVNAVLPTLASQWINFCWQPPIAQQISLRSNGTSPVPTELLLGSRQRSRIILTDAQLQRSEFLLPLPATVQQQYDALWQTIRT
ncbi:extracellular solute-binding protein [Gloeocapsopsis dulcis]|uniref:Polyamine ABC transporter substrate-binding protein n=1 Tax=Gloeocapsopsis dulcis AAB1 = 1H9 TaxID=1433147 RepID=A0A6N8FUY8_9CHRO|nr:extracellular solute-binding protein [Gloeocapsopsis dulcis]MUL36135.1 polyamine ABC transporter substrate-binding protein [Gloeocapsopsis dulcis AAB1 = 1H9]WNN91391.1 extracellular solute-binding protein [Gloeocapsopsis dulcis]